MVSNRYEESIKAALQEAEKIFKENVCSKGISVTINVGVNEVTTIDYEVKCKYVRVGD